MDDGDLPMCFGFVDQKFKDWACTRPEISISIPWLLSISAKSLDLSYRISERNSTKRRYC